MKRILVTLALAVALVIVPAQPAHAATLGTFYDGVWDSTQGSFSISGTTCGGGGLNLPTSWNDRITSLFNGCAHIVLYEHANYQGRAFHCHGSGCNLTGNYMNNRTTSIKFFAS